MKAVIFDLDGTLIDSAPAIAGIGNRLLTELGCKVMSLPEARSYVGHGAEAFVRQALDARGLSMTDADVRRFKEIYAEDDARRNTPYPHVERVLSQLAERDIACGICTNKPEAPTRTVLDVLDWHGRFDVVVGGDTLEVKKPDPRPLLHACERLGVAVPDIVYVGDSEVDAQTAETAGARFALFTQGYRKTPVDELFHTVRFDSYSEFLEVVPS